MGITVKLRQHYGSNNEQPVHKSTTARDHARTHFQGMEVSKVPVEYALSTLQGC
jgi:hypothetical protein